MVLKNDKIYFFYKQKYFSSELLNPIINYLRLGLERLAQESKEINKLIFITKYKILIW